MVNGKHLKLAILIDAENISHRYAKIILDEASNYGSVVYKRIYGDWSNPVLTKWHGFIRDYSIQPIQQFANTKGKNASDSAMIIDAMDLLHTGRLDGFCIVSSDSDFTRLAARLRESEMTVIGMGEKKTPTSFISACDRFQYLDVLLAEEEKSEANLQASGQTESEFDEVQQVAQNEILSEVKSGRDQEEIRKTIDTLLDEHSDEEGWCFLGDLGNQLLSRYPDFDARNFGYDKVQ